MAAGKAAGFWDAAVRSIIACRTAYMTQTISNIPSPLKTSLKKLRELETWHHAGLDVAKLALRIPPDSPGAPEIFRPSKLCLAPLPFESCLIYTRPPHV